WSYFCLCDSCGRSDESAENKSRRTPSVSRRPCAASSRGKSIRDRRGLLPSAGKIHTTRRTTPPSDRLRRGEPVRVGWHPLDPGRSPLALPVHLTARWRKFLKSRP